MRARVPAALAAAVAAGLSACAPAPLAAPVERTSVVTSTGILADIARNVAGDAADVVSLVPPNGDPHSYDPSLRDVRSVVYADVAFTNYALLEGQNLIRALDANLRDGVPQVSLAERAGAYAAEIIPLVEDRSLDTVWLGLRVRGTGEEHGATRSSEVELRGTALEGPGDMVAYVTGTFGEPARFFDSTDGFDPSDGYADDLAALPPDAHTHVSWAFTEPGVYTFSVESVLAPSPAAPRVPTGSATLTFAVGVDPHSVPGMEGAEVLGTGHIDLTVDVASGQVYLLTEPVEHRDADGGTHTHGDGTAHDPARTVIEVPTRALHEIPTDERFRFLGQPGEDVYQLPQAVLGRHVHGEIDPHLWQDVRNAMAYVKVIRDTLVEADPGNAAEYRQNAAAYLTELEDVDAYVAATIASIPPSRRHLVTTYDSFGYLGAAYDVAIAGFVTPNPSTEPSLAERRRLTETIRNLEVNAVFLEPNLASRSSTLEEVARDNDVQVCRIYGDTLGEDVTTYAQMMRFNADSLRDCLQ